MTSPNAILIEQPAGLTRTSLKRLARIAGVFYLIVGITGGFSEGYVDPKLYVAGTRRQRLGTSSRTPDLCASPSSLT
jgi:hypothetical protein